MAISPKITFKGCTKGQHGPRFEAIVHKTKALRASRVLEKFPETTLGASRIGGIDINKPRIRASLSAVTAPAPAPDGFTDSDFDNKVRNLTRQTEHDCTIRQAAHESSKPK